MFLVNLGENGAPEEKRHTFSQGIESKLFISEPLI